MDELIKELRTFRDERGWKKYHSPKNLAVSIAIEAAELLEHFQWIDDERVKDVIENKKIEIEEEVADIFIYLLFFCDSADIDLIEAFRKKMDKNRLKYPAGVDHRF
jgi:NTP pyrophosphatase (non-canonical NTP hydrolase)